jgi:hypothetical protein
MSVRGAPDASGLRRELLTLAQELGVDIAIQIDDLFRRNRRLVAFDMDSTLIQTEVIDELARKAGVGEAVSAITEAAMRGELDFQESLRRRLAQLEGLSASVLQEVAEQLPLTDGAEVLISTLELLAAVIPTTSFKVDRMAAACGDPGLLAADWAEELVLAGVPFRDAYGVIGRLMKRASDSGVDPRSMPEEELAALHDALPAAIAAVPDAAAAVDRKRTSGSPGKVALAEQIAAAERLPAG